MQALTNRNKQVERKPMTFMERMYLPAIFKGMASLLSHLFKKKPTISYPEAATHLLSRIPWGSNPEPRRRRP
jgi:formate hydrogenlyase subunit 6/NADH:ubiquinone oxidoreductase subunit I